MHPDSLEYATVLEDMPVIRAFASMVLENLLGRAELTADRAIDAVISLKLLQVSVLCT